MWPRLTYAPSLTPRAIKKVEAEKAEQRVETLRVRVAELDAELGALSNP